MFIEQWHILGLLWVWLLIPEWNHLSSTKEAWHLQGPVLAVSSFGFRVSGNRVSERRKEIFTEHGLCQIYGILGNLLTPRGFLVRSFRQRHFGWLPWRWGSEAKMLPFQVPPPISCTPGSQMVMLVYVSKTYFLVSAYFLPCCKDILFIWDGQVCNWKSSLL